MKAYIYIKDCIRCQGNKCKLYLENGVIDHIMADGSNRCECGHPPLDKINAAPNIDSPEIKILIENWEREALAVGLIE